MSPNAAVAWPSIGRIEWAAFPARSARARSPEKREPASPVAERTADRPKRAAGTGWRGGQNGGPSRSPTSSSHASASGPMSLR